MSEFYGFNCFDVSPLAFVGLAAHHGRFLARRLREQAQASGAELTVDQMHDLVFAETESEDEAQAAATRYAASLLKAGRTPG